MKPKVLAIDAESAILTMLRTALPDEGFDLSTVGSVKDFCKLDAVTNFDLYLIDINLADGNGLSILRKLRQKTQSGIILLSGRSSETDHVVGLEMGADDYVTKPFRIRELAARMNAVYRRTGGAETSPPAQAKDREAEANQPGGQHSCDFQFDGYRLRIAARALWRDGGCEIDLTSAEFNLLLALLKRKGQVLDRDQLMNAVKGKNWEVYDRAVDKLISRLRRKIPPPEPKAHYIRTVHGVGYVFAA